MYDMTNVVFVTMCYVNIASELKLIRLGVAELDWVWRPTHYIAVVVAAVVVVDIIAIIVCVRYH